MKFTPAHENIRAAMRTLLLILLCFPTLLLAADDLRQRQQELQTLKQQIQTIANQMAQDQRDKDNLAQDIERIEKRLQGLQQALAVINRDLNQAQEQSIVLQKERDALQETLQKHYHNLQAQIRAAYIVGRQAQTRMLLSQDDPNRLARLQTYLQYFQEQHSDQIEKFQTTLLALNEKNAQINEALEKLTVARTGQTQAAQAIESQRGSRQQVMQSLQQKLGAGGTALQQLRTQQSKLESLIDSLGKAVQRHSALPPMSENFARNKGKLVRPVDGPVLANFNQRKTGGDSLWKGVWLGAKTGTPVRAIAPARVVYVGWMHHYGLLVVLDHGKGYFSLYGHNQSALKSIGDEVKGGEAIAEAGDTGGHSKSGVYLEIRKGRDPQNPASWLLPQGK